MKRFFGVLLMLQPTLLPAQESLPPLGVGAAVPDVSLPCIINHPEASGSLSRFMGELLILDFWAGWCSSCHYILPELEGLQKQFEGRLRVLLVNAATTGDDEKSIEDFFRGPRAAKQYVLPSVVGDTVLHRLFPHKQLPHLVWIRSGRVVAITGPEALTAVQVEAALDGEPLAVRMKQDELSLPIHLPLDSGGSTGDTVHYRSLIYRQPEGDTTGTALLIDGASAIGHLKLSGCSLQELFIYAWDVQLPACQVLWEGDRPEHLRQEHRWCYELLLPSEKITELRTWMQQDLTRYFGCAATLGKRRMACLVLRERGKGRLDKPAEDWQQNVKKPVRHESPATLALALSHSLGVPVVDESRRDRVVELGEEAHHDVELLRQALRPYGLELAEGRRSVEVFVLKEKVKTN